MEPKIKDPIKESPTVKLNVDVLWTIFSFNTLTDDDFTSPIRYNDKAEFSIITARHTSQVCALWRSIMLSSPDIWSNTINLKYLQQKTDNWRKEVLKRTDRCLLSVIAHNLGNDARRNDFLFSLMKFEAGRMKRISISKLYDGGILLGPQWSTLFFQEAPHLEILHFRHTPSFPNYISLKTQVSSTTTYLAKPLLFCDKAPFLTKLTLGGVDAYLPGSWNSNINTLWIQDSNVHDQFFLALANMHSLEHLHVVNVILEQNNNQSISLPKLRRLYIRNLIDNVIPLLDAIVPNELCESAIMMQGAFYEETLVDEWNTKWLQGQKFAAHMKTTFSGSLHLKLAENHIDLHTTLPVSPFYPASFFELDFDFISINVPCASLDALRNICARTTTHASIKISRTPRNDALDASLAQFLGALSSVEVVHTKSKCLAHLTGRLQSIATVCFPHMHSLVLDDTDDSKMSRDLIADFIEQRRSAGCPLRKIDVSRCAEVNINHNIAEYLKGLVDLEVVWNKSDR